MPVRDTYQQLKTAQKKKDEVVQYKLGDAVTHPKFGHGIVEKINQRSGGVHLHIRFDGEVKCIDQKWLSRKKYMWKDSVKTNKQGSEVSEEDKRTRRTLEDEMTFFVCVNLYIDILSKWYYHKDNNIGRKKKEVVIMRKKSEMQKANEEFVKTYDDSKYPKPSVTADIVIFGMFDKEEDLSLIHISEPTRP